MSQAVLLLAALLLLTACRREDRIETYRVAKQPSSDMSAMGTAMGMKPAASSRDITWKAPSEWQVQPASAMRLGSYRIPGPGGQSAEFSIIPLSGEAGGDLANINRWRGQIELEPITESQLPEQTRSVQAGGRAYRLVEFVSRQPLIDQRYKKRLLAAIYTRGNQTWFFKMMGEDRTVEQAKPAFLEFLNTVQFRSNHG